MKRLIAICLSLMVLLFSAAMAMAVETDPIQKILLSSQESGGTYSHNAALNGEAVPEYDYAWHADPAIAHTDVKNSPAEYFTGTKPSGKDAVYIAHDIVYYPELEESKFQRVDYDGDMEYAYRYEAEGYTDYLFSTLPASKGGFPSHMMHSEEEAYQNAVLHITQPGTYELTGTWHGQVWIDLGDKDDVYADPDKKVTLILNGVDITCTVAPGLVFASVYECDNIWEDADAYSQNVDTSEAGANVILADGTVNNVSGTNIFRILKTKFKDEDSKEDYPSQKKAWKIDGAFYSYMSMNITRQEQGTGVLNIFSGFEGLDTEHHLTINGGNVYIYSQDDGINVNEDGVSVLTINGGNLHICAGLGSEGDGIDSNGFLVVNGGTVITSANPASDSGLDSDCGSFVNGGTVVALGAAMDWAESDESVKSNQPVLNLRFGTSQSADEAIIITDINGNTVFAYDPDQDEVNGENQRTYQGAILSGPNLEIGGEYIVYIGGDVEGDEISGVYDVGTITGFTKANQQCWSGREIGGHGSGKGKADFGFGERPERGIRPDGKQEPPNGFALGQMLAEGFGGRSENMGATCGFDEIFPLSQQVNAFSSVSDYRHDLRQSDAGSEFICGACGAVFSEDGEVLVQGTYSTGEVSQIWLLSGVAVGLMLGCGILLFIWKKENQ